MWLLYQRDLYSKLECTKRMGFWFLRREKTGILEPRAIKGSNHRLERPAYGVPRDLTRATLVEATSA